MSFVREDWLLSGNCNVLTANETNFPEVKDCIISAERTWSFTVKMVSYPKKSSSAPCSPCIAPVAHAPSFTILFEV